MSVRPHSYSGFQRTHLSILTGYLPPAFEVVAIKPLVKKPLLSYSQLSQLTMDRSVSLFLEQTVIRQLRYVFQRNDLRSFSQDLCITAQKQ